jgi:cardiolipin synthase
MNKSGILVLFSCVLMSSSAIASSTSDGLFENSSGSPLMNAIRSATRSLDIEIYTMNDANIRAEILSALSRRVKVRIVQEPTPVGAACHVFVAAATTDKPECSAEKQFVKDAISKGAQYQAFPKALCGTPNSRCYEHGKVLIADGQEALISTGNFDATSLCDISAQPGNCDRDFTIVTHDATIIRNLETILTNDLSGTATQFSALDSNLTVSPNSMKPLLDFINSATRTLQVENQYLEDPTMNDAIIAAAHRGVKVSVMVSSNCSFGRPTASTVTKFTNIYSAFDQAGIKTQIFVGRMHVGGLKGYLHAKAMVADGTRGWVGSVNGSTTAISDNRVFGLFFQDQTMVSTLIQSFEADFNNSLGETWQDSLQCKFDHVQ